MRMTRYWMTGCMALILLVAGRWPAREDMEESNVRQRAWITLTSKYGLEETIRQIERSARLNGLPVVARLSPQAPELPQSATSAQVPQTSSGPYRQVAQREAPSGPDRAVRVLVLGDAGGQTPMMETNGPASAELPLKVLIRQRADGRTEVSLSDPGAMALPEGVSTEMLDRVTALPQMVRAAIT
jgi:uncharacterized protein (DUF302 family)